MNPTTEPSRSYVRLAPGDPAPWFNQRSTSNPNYAFDTAAGRYIVLCFFASAGDPIGRAAMQVSWPTVNNSTMSGSAFSA